jgi:hypothetical protein
VGWKGFVNYSKVGRQFWLPDAGGPAYDFAITPVPSDLIKLFPASFHRPVSDVFDRKERP